MIATRHDKQDKVILLIMPRSDHAYPVLDVGQQRLRLKKRATENCRSFSLKQKIINRRLHSNLSCSNRWSAGRCLSCWSALCLSLSCWSWSSCGTAEAVVGKTRGSNRAKADCNSHWVCLAPYNSFRNVRKSCVIHRHCSTFDGCPNFCSYCSHFLDRSRA